MYDPKPAMDTAHNNSTAVKIILMNSVTSVMR